MSGAQGEAAVEQTDIGSYFIANYPPFSTWRPEAVAADARPALERPWLDMLPKMQRSHFVKKYSVQFINANGKLSAPFYFWDNMPHECSQTWQVVRSEFDQMMLENAREHGVEAYDGVHVVEVLFDGQGGLGVGTDGVAVSARQAAAHELARGHVAGSGRPQGQRARAAVRTPTIGR